MAKHTGVRKLPSGRFRARYFQGYDANGKRVYPAKTFDTEREAREWRNAEVNFRAPGRTESRAKTLGEYLDHWLTTKLDLRDHSVTMYREMIKYIKPTLGHVKLTKLTPDQVEKWQAALLARNLSPTTVSSARTILFSALKSAERKGMIRSNAVAATDGPKQRKSKRYPLSIEEALKFVTACQGMKSGLIFELSLACGLRPEEAIGLRWQDLDLSGSRGSLRVRQVIHTLKAREWKRYEPKTESSERCVVFPAELAGKLNEHRRTQLQLKLKAGQFWQNHDLVFTNGIGEPVRYHTILGHFKEIAKNAGLPPSVTPYTLRHAFVTFSLVAGIDIKTVSREVGHSKPSFTMDRYGHVLDEMHETAADRREALMKSRK